LTPAINVLTTGAGAPGAAGIIKCLQQEPAIRLIVADADSNAIGRYLNRAFYVIPKATDDGFVPALLHICRMEAIDLIMPLVTRELFPLSQQAHLFKEAGTKVMVSPPDAIHVANDKAACYRFLQDKGIAVPQFLTAETTEEFIHAAFALGHPQKPFCFKPAVANGSRGFRVVSEGINESEQLFHTKPYNIYITYTHAVKILSSQSFPPLVVSEYLPGEEYSVDCLAERGDAILVVPRLRQKMINGISVQGRFINDSKIIDYCKQIIKAVGLHGNIGIQVKRSQNGNPLLLEINPRVQGTIVAALGAGVNLPLLAVKKAMEIPIEPSEMAVAWGTSFSRVWTEVYY
jgi:carbamoyl-phosphate synthase large subunit